jgi:hypothetical protein
MILSDLSYQWNEENKVACFQPGSHCSVDLAYKRCFIKLISNRLSFYSMETILFDKISGTHTIKYSLSSEMSSHCSKQLAIVSYSEPEQSSPQPLTLLVQDSSGVFANQSLKATTSILMFIVSSLGLSAVNKPTHREWIYLNFIFGNCKKVVNTS